MFRERSDELRFTVAFIDLLTSFLAVVAAFVLRFFILDPTLGDYQGLELGRYVFVGCLLALTQTVVLGFFGLYRRQKFLSFLDEIGTLVAGVLFNIILSFAILYYIKVYDVSRLLPVFYGLLLLVFLVVSHNLFRRILIHRRRKGLGLHDLVIVGGNPTALKTSRALEKSVLSGYRVRGFLLEGHEESPAVPPEKILGNLADLESLLLQNPPGDLIYTGDKNYQENLKVVLEACDRHGIQLHVVPSFGELVTARGLLESLDGLPLISIRDIPARTGFNRVMKRTFDIVFSGAFLLVFSWLFLLVALAVKLTSRGPVFFLQDRVGLDNKVFRILKFRTMRVQTEQASNTVWTTKDDPRITPIGKFLRKSSLDEIPQFINIFIGQMSVVGPRPERPYYVDQFRDKYKYFKRRHAVKAGLTGWAQVNGLRGDTSIQDRIDADIYYIENWTFFLDLKIVLLTPFKGMIHKNAY
jgi:exopolysaccharide biosynthesis polyprenyl glycosylphosphotransferase